MAAAMETDRQLRWDDLLGSAVALANRQSAAMNRRPSPQSGDARGATAFAAPIDPWMAAVIAMADARAAGVAPRSVVLNRWGVRAWGGVALACAGVVALALVPVPAPTTLGAAVTAQFNLLPPSSRNIEPNGGAQALSQQPRGPGGRAEDHRSFDPNSPDESSPAPQAKPGHDVGKAHQSIGFAHSAGQRQPNHPRRFGRGIRRRGGSDGALGFRRRRCAGKVERASMGFAGLVRGARSGDTRRERGARARCVSRSAAGLFRSMIRPHSQFPFCTRGPPAYNRPSPLERRTTHLIDFKETLMPRLTRLEKNQGDAKAQNMMSDLDSKKMLLNIFRGLANSPAALNAYLQFSGALRDGKLDGKIREAIALAVGQANRCDYCLAAHTMLAKGAGLDEAAIRDARLSKSADPRTQAAVTLARRLVETKGGPTEADVSSARAGGLDDGDIAEVVANVALNIFTNYFNHVNQTDVDFPKVAVDIS
jgi:AhpD family alkylhydroperoxidase